jgi:hypothetical protein
MKVPVGLDRSIDRGTQDTLRRSMHCNGSLPTHEGVSVWHYSSFAVYDPWVQTSVDWSQLHQDGSDPISLLPSPRQVTSLDWPGHTHTHTHTPPPPIVLSTCVRAGKKYVIRGRARAEPRRQAKGCGETTSKSVVGGLLIARREGVEVGVVEQAVVAIAPRELLYGLCESKPSGTRRTQPSCHPPLGDPQWSLWIKKTTTIEQGTYRSGQRKKKGSWTNHTNQSQTHGCFKSSNTGMRPATNLEAAAEVGVLLELIGLEVRRAQGVVEGERQAGNAEDHGIVLPRGHGSCKQKQSQSRGQISLSKAQSELKRTQTYSRRPWSGPPAP